MPDFLIILMMFFAIVVVGVTATAIHDAIARCFPRKEED